MFAALLRQIIKDLDRGADAAPSAAAAADEAYLRTPPPPEGRPSNNGFISTSPFSAMFDVYSPPDGEVVTPSPVASSSSSAYQPKKARPGSPDGKCSLMAALEAGMYHLPGYSAEDEAEVQRSSSGYRDKAQKLTHMAEASAWLIPVKAAAQKIAQWKQSVAAPLEGLRQQHRNRDPVISACHSSVCEIAAGRQSWAHHQAIAQNSMQATNGYMAVLNDVKDSWDNGLTVATMHRSTSLHNSLAAHGLAATPVAKSLRASACSSEAALQIVSCAGKDADYYFKHRQCEYDNLSRFSQAGEHGPQAGLLQGLAGKLVRLEQQVAAQQKQMKEQQQRVDELQQRGADSRWVAQLADRYRQHWQGVKAVKADSQQQEDSDMQQLQSLEKLAEQYLCALKRKNEKLLETATAERLQKVQSEAQRIRRGFSECGRDVAALLTTAQRRWGGAAA
jgi:hypothetical protein